MGAVTDPRAALAGVTVLDLATFLAAPLCATLLGEFGAEVIKVEQPGVGDDLRRLGRAAGDTGSSYLWLVEARNKKSITCNLRDPEGQALLRRLGAGAHVVTENFRPGTLERWHLGWDALAAVRPSLVLVRGSAFGPTGPRPPRGAPRLRRDPPRGGGARVPAGPPRPPAGHARHAHRARLPRGRVRGGRRADRAPARGAHGRGAGGGRGPLRARPARARRRDRGPRGHGPRARAHRPRARGGRGAGGGGPGPRARRRPPRASPTARWWTASSPPGSPPTTRRTRSRGSPPPRGPAPRPP